jgi:hypothetical protein
MRSDSEVLRPDPVSPFRHEHDRRPVSAARFLAAGIRQDGEGMAADG